MDPARRAGSWAVIWTTGWLLLLSLLLPDGESAARGGGGGAVGALRKTLPSTAPLNAEGCGKNLLS